MKEATLKSKPGWIEICVRVGPKRLEEGCRAVAALFDRFGQGGAVIEARPSKPRRDARPVAWVKAYWPTRRDGVRRRKAIEDQLHPLRKLYSISEVKFRELAEQDWAEAWKKGYSVQKIGRSLVIVPSWKTYRAKPKEVVIRMDPGRAFGTGLHPTTRLCLIALEKYLQPGDRVLDVGTGSGILAIAAAKLGASGVTALDIEPDATEVARENAALNGVLDRVRIFAGTVESLSPKIQSLPFIVVNILAYTIIRMIPVLVPKLISGGYLIGGGILKEFSGDVERALQEAGLEGVERLEEGEWVTIVARVKM